MSFREGNVVRAKGYGDTTFKITHIFQSGKFATIEAFSVSKQRFTGQTIVNVLTNTLIPFKEDASQAAARIARETAEQK
jgi:hypothetical protein